MRSSVLRRLVILGAVALLGLLLPLASASAQKPSVRQAVSTFTYTQNMHPQGYSPRGNTPNLPGLTFTANSDLAFWGNLAFQGHYEGFRIINIASPTNPREISFTDCNGNQGDIVVYEDILVRAWNSAAPARRRKSLPRVLPSSMRARGCPRRRRCRLGCRCTR